MEHVKYFKRFRMELSLSPPLPLPSLPSGFRWLAWDRSLLPLHAEVKFTSFHEHEDAIVFPSLGTRAGCHDLMEAICYRDTFCAQATWLIAGQDGCVATVQGLLGRDGFGSLQNIGVVPEYRGLGLGRALVLQALSGFVQVGARRAYLEVTATNTPAVRLYRSIGFRAHRTLYRAVKHPVRIAATVG